MSRVCTVCTHPNRHEIEVSLVNRSASYRDIARQRSVSPAAVGRHVSGGHIAERLAKAREARVTADADKLLRHLKGLHGKTLALLDAAERAGDIGTAIRAVVAARGNLELLAKLIGNLEERANVNVSIENHHEVVHLQERLLVALVPYPDARAAVLRAIRGDANGSN